MTGDEVDDTARGMPLTGPSALAASLDLLGRAVRGEPPTATCPTDGEPLVMTMRYAGAEFVCMVCGRKLGFLAPTPAPDTPELHARYVELAELFDQGVEPGTVEAQS